MCLRHGPGIWFRVCLAPMCLGRANIAMNFKVALNIMLVFCGGSIASWALLSWINIGSQLEGETILSSQDGNVIISVGVIGLIMFIIGLVSQALSTDKED